MNKLVGIGKVENGQIKFSTVDGLGFTRPVSKPKKEEVEMKEVEIKQENKEVDLVFDFVGSRKWANKGQVIHVDFGKKQDTQVVTYDDLEAAVERGIKKALYPIFRYFVKGDNVKDILKGGDR